MDNDTAAILVYNLIIMKTNPSPDLPQVDRDSRLFMIFLTLVVTGIYIVTLVNVPATRQPGILVPLTLLTSLHVFLHWQLEKITEHSSATFWYIAGQGILALIIAWLASNMGMASALFLGLLGEAIGLLGLTRRGFMAAAYLLLLLIVSLVQFSGGGSANLFILGTLPMVIFVVIYVTLYMRQNDAREQAQKLAAELEIANHQLAEYAAQVEDLTIANERQRMARELHDTLSQGLAGIILQLEAIEAHLAGSRLEKAQNIIANAKLQARATLANARAAIDDLRKTSLDDFDSALRLEISRFIAATAIPCVYQAEQNAALPAPVKETIIRAVAEGLTNVARHAHASEARVSLIASPSAIEIKIQDNGAGFDPAMTPSGHYGLLGLRERIRLVNGSFDIHSETGKGTTLKINLPL
jgi:NarL family two-component system sensor histidine kinase YdfH